MKDYWNDRFGYADPLEPELRLQDIPMTFTGSV
jgi:hypothetical protein